MENNNKVDFFIKDLENKSILDEQKIEEMEKKKSNILGLIEYIKNLQVLLNEKDENGSIIRCDVGDGVYVNGKLNKKNKNILINIGKDIYIDLTFPEAIENLLNQQKIIDKKIIVLKNEIIKNKAYKKLTKGINETLLKHQLLEGNLIKKEENQNSENFTI